MPAPQPLPPERLYRHCDAERLGFATTRELEAMERPPGQERALEALELGAPMPSRGFNLFVMGPNGAGKLEMVQRLLAGRAAAEASPADWCYLNNFDEPTQPRLLRLPPSWGSHWRRDLEQLVDELRTAIPATFESDEYRSRLQELQQQLNRRQREAFESVQQEAEQHSVTLLQTPSGFTVAPVKDGEVIDPEQFQQLPEAERRGYQQAIEALQERLQQVVQQIPKWRKEIHEQIRKLNEEMTLLAIGQRIEELRQRYSELPAAAAHLDALHDDLIENVDTFRSGEQEAMEQVLGRYQANLLVGRGPNHGAPVVYEDMPTHQRLVGRIEHHVQQGALVTDFSLIRPGSLHLANGGYLILDAHKVLTQPFAWESLKRTLFAEEVRIESLEQVHGFWSTVTLEPEPMPLRTKVVLLGDRMIYYLLSAYDPDFPELFKIEADLEDDLPRDAETERLYARMIGTLAAQHGLRPLDRHAVARVIEHGSRMAEDSERLAAGGRAIADLLQEADHYAAGEVAEAVGREHVERALEAQERRASRLRDRNLELIRRGTLVIFTEGAYAGSVNGLSVLQLGGYAFGRPTRITATARPGRGQLVDIEREAKLGGNIHSKGVMILSRFLASRFAPESDLSLSASLAFEQSYGGIDGDSASVAELCALLSATGEIPLDHGIAVTGSVNQLGEVQAVGGVNEKVEGFFEVCRQAGLTGQQGVALPAANVAHLMLRREVREAVAAGQFRIYPLAHVDEALALLTHRPAGRRDAAGRWPEGTVNRAVAERLARFAEVERRHHGDDGEPASEGSGAHEEEDGDA